MEHKIRHSIEDTILCRIETDHLFLEDIREIADKKQTASNNSLFQQSNTYQIDGETLEEIHLKANWHTQANIINKNNIDVTHEERVENMNCECGCKKEKGEFLSIWTLQERIASLGSGVILVFYYLKHMKLLIAFAALCFGTFSIMTNQLFADPQTYDICTDRSGLPLYYCEFNQSTCFLSVRQNSFLTTYQYILGLIMVIVWLFGIKIMINLGQSKNKEINNLMDSSADSTIILSNLPSGKYQQQQLLEYLKFLWLQYMHQSQQPIQSSIPQIKSIQIIYNMEACRQKINQLTQLAIAMMSYFEKNKYRMSNEIMENKVSEYRKAKKLFLLKLRELEMMRKQFLQNSEFRSSISTSLALVEFETKEGQAKFLKIMESVRNPIQNALLPTSQLQFKSKNPQITRSPEPSDILWMNCEKQENYFRIVLIWVITIIILYAGYALISYIQTLPVLKSLDHVVSTIFLQLLNRLIWFWLSIIVTYEQNNTKTEAIISSMKKSIIAQTINIIVNPIIAVFVNNKGLYGVNGLSGMALTYQMIMLGMMFLYNIFNPFYLGKKLLLYIPCIRNCIIKYQSNIKNETYTYEQIKPTLSFYEGPQFPIAGSYVYMTTAIFHAMFYCHLQPAILFLIFINMTVFHFIMKYMLFKRCKYPQLTNQQIFQFAMFLANCAAAYYGVGSIFFYAIDSDNPSINFFHLIPSILCLIIWFLSNLQMGQFWSKIINKIITNIKKYNRGKKSGDSVFEHRKSPLTLQHVLENRSLTIESHEVPCRRRQSYYTDSNTNILLQFESDMKNIRQGTSVHKGKRLKQFCESFLEKEKSIYISGYTKLKEKLKLQRIDSQEIYIPATKVKEKAVRFREQSKIIKTSIFYSKTEECQ